MHPIDALGNPIVIGNWYGTSVKYEGHAFVIIGQAVKVKEDNSTVTIHIHKRRKPTRNQTDGTWSYQDMKFGDWGFEKRSISYASEIMFPVPPQDVA